MGETFTGKLEWITMCGNIDVRHPDGRVIRCYSMTGEHSREADRLGRNAFVTVEIPDNLPGAGKRDPRILAVSGTPSPQTHVNGEFPGFEQFAEYFVRNYPGPDTVIFDPKWHAPKIYRAALSAYRAALAAEGK
jgi:hypothetical protein